VVARLVGGVSAGMAYPTTLALVTALWAGPARTWAIALWLGIGSALAALGPLVSGVLLEYFWWDSVFVFAAPFAVIALVMAIVYVPAHVNESTAPVDNLGGILSVVLVTALILAINLAPVPGKGALTLGLAAIVVAAVIAFLLRERRASTPLYDLHIAGRRVFWVAAVGGIIVFGSLMGAMFIGQQFMQNGDGARSFTCDASVTPVVTGEVNPAALDDLIRLCAELDKRRHAEDHAGDAGDPAPDTLAEEALEQAIIGKAVDFLSGPGGLASFLRRRQLGARLGGPSLPLDIGVSADIPAAIRRAVILRDQHCRFPGGCDQPAAGCEVHHLRHRKDGGPTSVKDCALFCFFHHQVVIHQWGWTVVLNPDGTTTAWNKDKTKIIHSHSPPVRPG